MSDRLEKACKEFLREFRFARLEWDGNELTVFAKNGEPLGAREFTTDTKTRRAFKELEDLLLGRKLASYRTTR